MLNLQARHHRACMATHRIWIIDSWDLLRLRGHCYQRPDQYERKKLAKHGFCDTHIAGNRTNRMNIAARSGQSPKAKVSELGCHLVNVSGRRHELERTWRDLFQNPIYGGPRHTE